MNALVKPTLAFWSDAEELECASFLQEAPDVMTFCFRSPTGALFSYEPGQFLTLELPLPGGAHLALARVILLASSVWKLTR